MVTIAKIIIPKAIPPTCINRFLGLNENHDGEYGLKIGEAGKQIGWRVTSGYQLKRMEGYKTLFSGLVGPVQGMWYGKLNGSFFFLFVNNGHLWRGNLADGTKTDIGTLTDAPTSFQEFGSKVYILNGHEYKSFDGTTFQVVAGYRPKIAIDCPPSGGIGSVVGDGLGRLYEQINVLTGAKHQTFSPTGTSSAGTSTVFQLAETNIDSVDFVKVPGALKVPGTDYTVNLVTGAVTFVTAPPGGTPGSVDIGWTKGTGQRALIENCRFAMDYSGQTDSRVFLWGNSNYKNRRFWSGLAATVPSAEYFEANAYDDLGSGQYAITDIVKMGDIQKIYFENGAMFSNYATETDSLGNVMATFPVYELSDEIGNVAYNQVQIIQDKPLTLFNGVYAWENSNVRFQYIHNLISQRVQNSLDDVDLSTAVTYNWQENKEYWLNIGSTVWIYNYLNNTWYKRNNVNATCFIAIDGDMYFGTNGTIEKFGLDLRTDNGALIETIWEMGFYDFEAEYLKKYLSKLWVALKPTSKSKVVVRHVTNNDGTSLPQTIAYNLATFKHLDFKHFSFKTSYNAQPFRLSMKAKGFDYLKIILSSDSLTDVATILSINILIRMGGKV